MPKKSASIRAGAEHDLARLHKRLAEIVAIDFAGAMGREPAESAIRALEARLRGAQPRNDRGARPSAAADYLHKTWVTRANVAVDRIACAWLVTRFIDPAATFALVNRDKHVAKADEVTFDMFEGTFTHEGDRCTFEVLVEAFALKAAGLQVIAEIVHDIDVKDGKFARPEAAGIASVLAGISVTCDSDEARLSFGRQVFDALLEQHRHRRSTPRRY